jgi:2-methylisocitrate lyase-like PEP mutase family enzyme
MTDTSPLHDDLGAAAERLRAVHRPGDPLVLVNVWDAASARRVEAAGARAVGTSSLAIAESLGVADDHSTPVELVFDVLSRIVAAVTVPVTADLLDGYGLAAAELVERMLVSGVVGCNLEDSDHTRPGHLLDPHIVAERLAAVRAAASRRDVNVVVNARIDTNLYAGGDDPATAHADILRRARLYLDAGADCVYPIRLTDPPRVAELVEALGAPVNANLGPGGSVAELAAAGAARISIGPMAHRATLGALDDVASKLLGPLTGR